MKNNIQNSIKARNTFDLSFFFVFKRKHFNASICFFYVTPLFDISPFFGVLDTETSLKTRTRRTLEGGRQGRGQGREPPQASDAVRDRPDSWAVGQLQGS